MHFIYSHKYNTNAVENTSGMDYSEHNVYVYVYVIALACR